MNFRILEDLIINRRRTGKSTALAFKAISEAIDKPLQPIKLKDHSDTYLANKLLLGITTDIIKKYLKCKCEGE